MKHPRTVKRREFIAGAGKAGAAALSAAVIPAALVRGTRANSKISIGLVGCGGRGGWIAGLFEKHGGYKFVACGDYYPDQTDKFGEKFGIPIMTFIDTPGAYPGADAEERGQAEAIGRNLTEMASLATPLRVGVV